MIVLIKASLTKYTAPYRGTTDTEDYLNLFGEILHQIRYLMFKIDRNDNFMDLSGNCTKPGQTDYINNNLDMLTYEVSGHRPLLCSIKSEAVLYKEGTEEGWYIIRGTDNYIKSKLTAIEDKIDYFEKNIGK